MAQASREPVYDLIEACFEDLAQAGALLDSQPELIRARTGLVEETALHYLVIEGQLEAARFLIRKGADVNTRDTGGMTPLISSALLGYLDIARVLLAHGADVNAVSGTMGSALHAVVSSERPEAVQMIELLAAHGAAVNALDDLGETPLWTAVSRRAGNRLMMEALLRAGADVNVVARGRSLLHEAVEKETAETVSLLLRHGADRALTDEAGASALDLARELGREEIARLLERGEPSRG